MWKASKLRLQQAGEFFLVATLQPKKIVISKNRNEKRYCDGEMIVTHRATNDPLKKNWVTGIFDPVFPKSGDVARTRIASKIKEAYRVTLIVVIRYFVAILRFVAIYALFGNLWVKNSLSWARSALLHGIYCIFHLVNFANL